MNISWLFYKLCKIIIITKNASYDGDYNMQNECTHSTNAKFYLKIQCDSMVFYSTSSSVIVV